MDAKTRHLAWSLLIVAVALTWAATASGQDLSGYFPQGVPGYDTAPGVTVQSRTRPLYDPVGLRAGSFLLYPRVDLGLGYDSNLLGTAPTPGSQLGSWLFDTRASVRVSSVWGRDSLGGYFSVDHADDLNLPSQSHTDWTGSVGGTLDFGEDHLTLGAAHLLLHQPPTAIGALPTDQPVPYQVNDLRASYVHDFDRLSLIPDLDFTTYNFSNTTVGGVPLLQAYRDRNVLQVGLTARYEAAPLRTLLFVLRGTDTSYTMPQPGTPSRNSTGGLALIGIDRNDGVWDLRLLLGWEQRDFAAQQYKSHGAPAAQAEVIWSPSGLTTVTGTLARTIEDAAQEGVAGYSNTTARLVIDHEYLRNVLLNGFGSVQHAAFLQGGGSQTLYSLGGGVTWLMNRNMRLSATEALSDMRSIQGTSGQTGGSYLSSLTLLTLGLGL